MKAEARLRFVFEWFDTNGDGRVDSEELNILFGALQLPVPDIELELALLGTSLDFDEFVEVLSPHTKHVSHLLNTFRSFDMDNDGFVDATDLRQMFDEFGIDVENEEIDEIIERIDQNANGKIDFKEYLQAGSACFATSFSRNIQSEDTIDDLPNLDSRLSSEYNKGIEKGLMERNGGSLLSSGFIGIIGVGVLGLGAAIWYHRKKDQTKRQNWLMIPQ